MANELGKSKDLVAQLQQKLAELQRNPIVVVHQTRDVLAMLCGNMKIVLSQPAPTNAKEWEQEFQAINDLQITAEQYGGSLRRGTVGKEGPWKASLNSEQ